MIGNGTPSIHSNMPLPMSLSIPTETVPTFAPACHRAEGDSVVAMATADHGGDPRRTRTDHQRGGREERRQHRCAPR